ncbi:hypothetical protein W02_16910 [Nitrospira sp. KM1]|nr:hypothetical protein W02_16910 [Nitrospira sp. KM1]
MQTIPSSVRIQIPFLAIEGADHMPGIPAFEWPKKDLHAAIIDYVEKRRTFVSVGNDGALTLSIKSWLMMRSRTEYRYTVRLESDLGPTGKPPITSYVAEAEEKGSIVRWVTASDRNPIERAVQATLDDLLAQIEADAELFR